MVLALSSCSPEIKGITGLMRTDNGLEGAWIACPGDDLQGALLIRDSNTDHSQRIGRWETSAPVNRAAWLIEESEAPSGWDVWKPARDVKTSAAVPDSWIGAANTTYPEVVQVSAT